MILGNLEEVFSSMFNDSACEVEEVKSQGFETHRPPAFGQGFSFADREDVGGEGIESPPEGLDKEAFRGEHPCCQITLNNIINLLNRSAAFSLPAEQSLPIPAHHVGEDGKVVLGLSILKEFSLGRTVSDGEVAVGFHPSFREDFEGKIRPQPTPFVQQSSPFY